MGDNKIIDGRETQKEAKKTPAKQQNKTKQKPKKQKKTRFVEAIMKGWELNVFVVPLS